MTAREAGSQERSGSGTVSESKGSQVAWPVREVRRSGDRSRRWSPKTDRFSVGKVGGTGGRRKRRGGEER